MARNSPLTSGLVGQFFGIRYLATLFGIVFASHQLGAFTSSWIGGILFDETGSYDSICWFLSDLNCCRPAPPASLMNDPFSDRKRSRRVSFFFCELGP